MCLWNTDVPDGQKSQNMAKNFKSYILTLSHPKGRVMSAKCDELIDELAVQVWLLYHHPDFFFFLFLATFNKLNILPECAHG